jgi:hypothetical protein
VACPFFVLLCLGLLRLGARIVGERWHALLIRKIRFVTIFNHFQDRDCVKSQIRFKKLRLIFKKPINKPLHLAVNLQFSEIEIDFIQSRQSSTLARDNRIKIERSPVNI